MLQTEAAPVATGKSRVLLVDDHALLRTGVANIINQETDLRVVAEAGNGVEAIEAYERHRPDVTLLDLRMPVMEGVEVVRVGSGRALVSMTRDRSLLETVGDARVPPP